MTGQADRAERQATGALKEKGAAALERAWKFVQENASETGILYARVVLRDRPVEDAIAAFAAHQLADGSHPATGSASDVDRLGAIGRAMAPCDVPDPIAGTLLSLSRLADLRGLHGPGVERAVRFLASSQLEDGSWGRSGPSADLRLFATGMLAGILGRTPYARPHVLAQAGSFIAIAEPHERIERDGWPALAAFARFFTNVQHERGDELLQWCGRELERGFRTRRLDAESCARVLLYCDAVALPGARLEPAELLASLFEDQAADGGFDALCPDGPRARVSGTLDAMLAIVALCSAL